MFDQEGSPSHRPQERTDAGALDRAIQADVIPRLLQTFMARAPEAAVSHPEIGEGAPLELATRLLTDESDDAEAFIAAFSAAGVPSATLLLDLFTPAARELGRRWADDEASFIDVSIALCRIHRLAQAHAEAMAPGHGGHGGRALITGAPGAQHQLGALIVEAFMRSAGWRVDGGPYASAVDLAADIARRPYHVLGLSIATREDCPAAMEAIRRARVARPVLFVMVGGPALDGAPDMARALGADATAATAPDAVALADQARTAH